MKSATLRRNYLAAEDNNLKKIKMPGYQAHHIIPKEIIEEYSDSDTYYDEEWNCLMLPEDSEYVLCNHRGSHPDYTKFVGNLIEGVMKDDCCGFREAATEVALFIRIFYNENEDRFVRAGLGGQPINDFGDLVQYVDACAGHEDGEES